MRAFIAIDVEINEKIVELYDDLKKLGGKLKLVETENVHLTIKFLGDIDDDMASQVGKIMKDNVCGIDPYTATLKGVGVFPNNQNIRVVWIGFHDGGKTATLSKNIDEQLIKKGFKKEKSYMPHVTIARMKSSVGRESVLQIVRKYETAEFGSMICTALKLKKSTLTPDGPIYTDVEVVPL